VPGQWVVRLVPGCWRYPPAGAPHDGDRLTQPGDAVVAPQDDVVARAEIDEPVAHFRRPVVGRAPGRKEGGHPEIPQRTLPLADGDRVLGAPDDHTPERLSRLAQPLGPGGRGEPRPRPAGVEVIWQRNALLLPVLPRLHADVVLARLGCVRP